MKKLILGLAVVLAGCASLYGPVLVVQKTGSTAAERQKALDDCNIESFKSIPQAFVTDVSPGMRSPGHMECRGTENHSDCFFVDGIEFPPTVTTRDANADLRTRYVGRCLMGKGFQMMSKPICNSKQDSDLYRANADNQPDAAMIKCVPQGTS